MNENLINDIQDNELKLIAQQMFCIANGDPIPDVFRQGLSTKYSGIQAVINQHEMAMLDGIEFLDVLRVGDLTKELPKFDNKYYENLNAIHKNLKEVLDGVNKIIDGNYEHRLVEENQFSKSINLLAEKLQESRELELKQAQILEDNNRFLQTIIGRIDDRIIITDPETNEVLYTNNVEDSNTNPCTNNYNCLFDCKLFEYLVSVTFHDETVIEYEYTCGFTNKSYFARSYNAHWDNKSAYIHFISNVTEAKNESNKIQQMIYTDELTRLYNRRFGMDTLESLMKTEKKFTFCMVDIDGLKYANDTYGHSAGDDYLRNVADELLGIFSGQDVVCRLGGDEFAIISEKETEKSISAKLEIVNYKLKNVASRFPMAISFGSVVVLEDKTDISALTIMHIADKKMYEQKRSKK